MGWHGSMGWHGVAWGGMIWYRMVCLAGMRSAIARPRQPGITARLAAQQDTPGVHSPVLTQRSLAFTACRSQVEGAGGSAACRALHLPDGRRAHLDGRDHAAQRRLHRQGHPLRHEQVEGARGDERCGGNCWQTAGCWRTRQAASMHATRKGTSATFQNAWCAG